MADSYFVVKPQVISARQWVGDNLESIQDWVVGDMPVTDNGDGSLTIGGGWYPPNTLPLNGWVGRNGTILHPETYQEVTGPSVDYVVE